MSMQRFAQTQFLESFSPESRLDIGLSFMDILDFRVSPSASAGGDIEAAVLIKNIGDMQDRFRLEYYRWEGAIGGSGVTVGYSDWIVLNGGEQVWVYGFGRGSAVIDQMPNRDNVIYRVVTWRFDGVNDVADDMDDKVVQLLTQINTTLSTAIFPIKVPKGGKYVHSGKLTRNDVDLGVSGETVLLERYELVYADGELILVWHVVGQATTDANGNYVSGEIVAPSPDTIPASYQVRAHYMGSAILGLSESYSSTSNLAVSIQDLMPFAIIAVGVVAGIVLLNYTLKGKKRRR